MRHEHEDLNRLKEMAERVTAFTSQFWAEMDARPVSAGDQLMPHTDLGDQGLGFDETMAAFEAQIAPHLSGSAGSRYWGFVTGGSTPAAMMGDWLTAAVDQNLSSPGDSIASSVEVQVIDWLRQLFHLPEAFFGLLTTGATAANLLGIMCGRQHTGHRLGFNVAQRGLVRPIKVLSGCPHASLIKSMGMAGLGRASWQAVATLPGREAVDVAALEDALVEAGPGAFVVANAGTVTSTDFDDLTAVARVCRRFDAWLHVDAAFGLFARVVDPTDSRLAGLELADSITSDGHKWLNVPYDCGFFFTRHAQLLREVCHVGAPYLETNSQTPTFLSHGIENSRRFRALPVWFALMAYGRKGVAATVDNCIKRAAQLADWLAAHDDYELLVPCKLNVVLFALSDLRRSNKEFIRDLNNSGEVFVSPGAWQGRAGVRVAFSNWLTSSEDVVRVTRWLDDYAKR